MRGGGIFSTEDLIEEGFSGLLKAVKHFKPQNGFKFTSFAGRCISNEIFMFFRREKKHDKLPVVSLDDVVARDNSGNELTFEDILTTEDDLDGDLIREEERTTQKKWLVENLKKLEPIEQKVIVMKYLSKNAEIKQNDIAKTLKLTQSGISKIAKRAIRKLREYAFPVQTTVKELPAFEYDKMSGKEIASLKDDIKNIIKSSLSDEDAKVMMLKYFCDKPVTRKEISQIIGCKPDHITYINQRCQKKICKILNTNSTKYKFTIKDVIDILNFNYTSCDAEEIKMLNLSEKIAIKAQLKKLITTKLKLKSKKIMLTKYYSKSKLTNMQVAQKVSSTEKSVSNVSSRMTQKLWIMYNTTHEDSPLKKDEVREILNL